MKVGEKTVTGLKLGTVNISRAYLGSTLVWEAGGAPGGFAASHDVSLWTEPVPNPGSYGTRGFTFRANGDCEVGSLRFYNGVSAPVTATVKLWDANASLLASREFIVGANSGWNEEPVTPVQLANGAEYVIAADYGPGSASITVGDASAVHTLDPHVIFVGFRSANTSQFPATSTSTRGFAAGFGLSDGGATGAAAYRYIRLLITANNGDARTGIGELQLFDRSGGQNIALDQLRTLSADVEDGTFVVGNAFDGNTTTTSWRSDTSALPHWIRVQLPGERSVASYKVTNWTTSTSAAARAPRDWTLQGSNDGSSWETIDQVSGETGWSQAETRTYTV